jgi:hypothetical protein
MSRRPRKANSQKWKALSRVGTDVGIRALYEGACHYAAAGQTLEAQRIHTALAKDLPGRRSRALVRNDQAILAAVTDDPDAALQGLHEALTIDPQCEVARVNLTSLEDQQAVGAPDHASRIPVEALAEGPRPARAGKVTILSFLFNWPSSGGGNVHTAELAHFLTRAGYAVRHFYPRYLPWDIGKVEGAAFPSEALSFDEQDWNVPAIQTHFRQAVDAFGPDFVLLMDSWNFKPHLAEALRGYPCFLRFQALEWLCPLNNVRLLLGSDGRVAQCPRHRLGTPEACPVCLQERGQLSGGLDRAERALAGVGTPEYQQLLCRTLQ